MEALDLTAERLRHLGDAFTATADRARATMDRYAHRDDAERQHPVREDDQQAHRPHAIRHRKEAPPQKPSREPLVWPTALRDCVAEDGRYRRTPPPPVDDGLYDPGYQPRQQEADIVHRLLGLIGYAADRRNIELAAPPDLADAIFDLYNDSQQAASGRR